MKCVWSVPVEKAAQCPVPINEKVEGSVEEEHGQRVIKQPQHEDGVDAVRGAADEYQHVWGQLEGEI